MTSASASARPVSPAALARDLLTMWQAVMRDSGAGVYAVFEELDLSLTQVKTLHALGGCGADEPSVRGLAERTGMSDAAISRTVDGLLHRGWIARREDPADRRVKRLTLTPQGRATLERIEAARLAGLEQWTAQLTPDQRAALAAGLPDLS